MSRAAIIRRRVLRGIALNRRPGLHFPANFLDISFDRVSRDGVQLSIGPGPWCIDAGGEVDLGALAILADIAIGTCVRAHLSPERRVATVSFALQFTGAPRRGRLRAHAEFQGFLRRGAGQLGLGRVSVEGAHGQICFGTGGFMALSPPRGVTLHPVPFRNRNSVEPERITDLSKEEIRILEAAERALKGKNFIQSFWGGSGGVLRNGLHAGNRVGHAQGGISLALAAADAAALLPRGWTLSSISGYYVSPGEGRTLRAKSELIHQGRLTAVVATRVVANRRLVIQAVTTHSLKRG